MTSRRTATTSQRAPLLGAFGVSAVLLWSPSELRAAEASPADPCNKSSKAGSTESKHDSCGRPTVELTLDFESAYVFRGNNVFQTNHQDDQNWVAIPRVIVTDSQEKLSVGYSSAYQLNGDNLWANVYRGVGSEQNLFADYDLTPTPHFVISPGVGMYLYPEASTVPFLFEVASEFWYVGPIEVGAYIGYLGAFRPGPLPENYLYLSPRIVKSFKLSSRVEFGLRLVAGAKVRAHGDSPDNTFDLLAAEYFRVSLFAGLFVDLKAAFAWTNLEPRVDPTTKAAFVPAFVDECAPFWGFTLGANL
jgi:hypothetical protein